MTQWMRSWSWAIGPALGVSLLVASCADSNKTVHTHSATRIRPSFLRKITICDSDVAGPYEIIVNWVQVILVDHATPADAMYIATKFDAHIAVLEPRWNMYEFVFSIDTRAELDDVIERLRGTRGIRKAFYVPLATYPMRSVIERLQRQCDRQRRRGE